MAEFKIELGVPVMDKITGFRGTVTARAEYLTGCLQYCVAPQVKDNDFKRSEWLDEDRLEVTERVTIPPPPSNIPPGGPQTSPAPAK